AARATLNDYSSVSHARLPHPFSLSEPAHRHALHSFPTRRSSDLHVEGDPRVVLAAGAVAPLPDAAEGVPHMDAPAIPAAGQVPRSEEHTSELQSRFDLVCRLLLEKKNTRRKNKVE